jgi:hypothetical protein
MLTIGGWRRSVLGAAFALAAASLLTMNSTSDVGAAGSSTVARSSVSETSGCAVIDSAGGVITYGSAGFHGDLLADKLNAPVVSAAADRAGYWMVAADGGIFSFGDARFYGSMGGRSLNRSIVGMAATPDGHGYWMVAADGGIFSFGDARFYGSMGSTDLNGQIVGMAATAGGSGYRLVGSDGGIYSFGNAPFEGSLGENPPPSRITAMTTSPDGNGYWMVDRQDSIYAFGDAPYEGGASSPLHPPLYPAGLSPVIPSAVALVMLPKGEQATHTGRERVAFVGDSLAWYEEYFTSLNAHPYLADNGATPSCGFTTGATMQEWSTPGQHEDDSPACTAWTAQLTWETQRFHPDAVVMQVGYWEVQNRLWNGRYVNLSDPSYAASIEANLRLALRIVHADGANVLLATAPYYGDGTPAWEVNDFNSLVMEAASADSSFVETLNVNHLLSPSGTYSSYVNGVLARRSDKVHLTRAGVQQLIDPSLNPLVDSLALPIYEGAS